MKIYLENNSNIENHNFVFLYNTRDREKNKRFGLSNRPQYSIIIPK